MTPSDIASVAEENGLTPYDLAYLFSSDFDVDEHTWNAELIVHLIKKEAWSDEFIESAIRHEGYLRRGGTWNYEEWTMGGEPTK